VAILFFGRKEDMLKESNESSVNNRDVLLIMEIQQ